MRIHEFSIRRYGPLPDTGRMKLGNFCLFFGNNEDGKTLTIDALTKILFGKDSRIFKKIDRVEEEPEGFVILKDDKEKEIKLPEKGNLTKLTGISSAEARNIFIIRDSDLSIAKESEHYRSITDRLTGMKTDEIEKIKDCLLEIGKLTPGGDLRDIKDEKLRNRVREARELIEDIDNLIKEVKEGHYDEIEKEVSRISRRLQEIDQKLSLYEQAENRENYEKGIKALQDLETALKKLQELDVFTEEDEQEWARHGLDLKREKERRKKLKREFKKLENKLDETEGQLKRINREFEVLEKTKKKIDDDIKLELKNYEIKAGEQGQRKGKSSFLTKSALVFSLFFMISMVGLILNPNSILFLVFSILFLFIALGLGISRFQLVREEAWIKGMFERIKLETAKLKLQGETVEETQYNIKKFDDQYSMKNKELEEISGDVKLLKGEMRKLDEKDISEVEKRIKNAEDGIRKIKSRSYVNTLETYRKKLKEIQNKNNLIDGQIRVLEALFGEVEEELSEKISVWREKIIALEIYKDRAKGIEFNKAGEQRLKDIKRDLLEKKEDIENKMKNFRDELGDIERRANSIIKLESDFLHCKTSIDIEAIEKKLKEFIENNEINRTDVLIVKSIFEDIESEEERKVSDLFGKNSTISKYFSKITNGIYNEVNFVPEERKIYVKTKDEDILEVEKLSGGAYDQLYFSIRLGLGENLLLGNKGFFIMDDPFIKADKNRLKEQVGILKSICESGWQVMYFTAKEEVKEALKNDIKNRNLNYFEVQGIFS